MKRLLLIFVVLAMLLVACQTTLVETEPPEVDYSVGEQEPEQETPDEPDNMENKPNENGAGFSAEETEYLMRQAKFLTAHLITLSYVGGGEFDRNAFVLMAGGHFEPERVRSSTGISIDNPEYTLFDSFGFVRGTSSRWEWDEILYPVDSVNRIVYEVFGDEEWVLEGGDVLLDEERQVYQTNLEFGLHLPNYRWREMTTELYENPARIAVSFELLLPTSSSRHTITFQLMRDEQRAFLRLLGIEPPSTGLRSDEIEDPQGILLGIIDSDLINLVGDEEFEQWLSETHGEQRSAFRLIEDFNITNEQLRAGVRHDLYEEIMRLWPD